MKTAKSTAILFLLILLGTIACSIVPCMGGEKAIKGPMQAGKRDLCPVCGMFVHKYPNWLAQIVFSDGTCAFFDGAKDMFKYLFEMKKYNPKKSRADITAFWVTDYYTTKWIDGERAYYVIGSDTLGPMGHELVPHGSERAAQSFAEDHAGETILNFNEVDLNLVESLR
jgi:copper chaperone NosL